MTDSLPVLVIEQDAPLRGNGLVGRLLAARGLPQLTLRTWEDSLSDVDPGELAGIVALGGTQHAWDELADPWLADERRLLRAAHDEGVPVLGICLGAQLLALALGGQVVAAEVPERGVYDVELLAASRDDPLFGPAHGPAPSVYQWHMDAFTLPPGATLLARSRAAPVQAFRLDRSWGVQFHPEVDDALASAWFGSFPDACAEAGVDEAAVRAEFARREAAPFDTFAARLIEGFLTVVSALRGADRERV